MLTLTYLALAVVGAGYVVVAALLGHLADAFGGDGGHAHGGGHDAGGGAYGVEGAGHGAVSATDVGASSFHFPFFSPLAVATLAGALGAWGLVAKYGFRAGDGVSLLAAIPLALATAYAVTYAGWRLVQGSRGSSAIRLADLVGAPAEVLTPIPAGGVGEIAATVGGQRYTGPAREAGGREVPRGALVTVVRVVGATLVVAAPSGAEGAVR
jgi:membrane protein implicated in regulation of membrane protease activity